MSMTQIVLMNDTDAGGQHFGCARVMSTLRAALGRSKTHQITSIAVGTAWHKDADLTRQIAQADILVVNGEGTLHHGKRRGKWLLEAASHARRHGARTYLLNALWQDNPEDWTPLIRQFDKIWCRDSRSAARLSEIRDEPVGWIGDLSMCGTGLERAPTGRSGIIIGDSVISGISRQLDSLSRQVPGPVTLIPLLTQKKFIAPDLQGLRRHLRIGLSRMATWRAKRANPHLRFLPSEQAYTEAVSRAALSVTGRFHAVCIAVTTRTPFVAISSNSHKIAALIDDLGLDQKRLVAPEALNAHMLTQQDWGYSPLELERIEARLAQWRAEAQAMFAEITAGPARHRN